MRVSPTPLLLLAFTAPASISFAQTAAVPHNPTGIDFSFAGYEAGPALPSIPAVLTVRPTGSDDTALLQSAIDRIATLPIQPNGFRSALLLQPGRYRIAGQLTLRASGIVLRGSGPTNTTLIAEGLSRRSLIEAGALTDPTLATPIEVTEDAPAGSLTLTLTSTDSLTTGDHIVVRRPSTAPWISAISMSGLPGTFANQRLDWQPGSHDLVWDRTILSIDPTTHTITLDAPITTALEKQYGAGTVAKLTGQPPITHIGIEDLTLESTFDPANPKDEDHAWIAILFDHLEDAFVRNVTTRHFAASAVHVNLRARRITITDTHAESPIAEFAGYRRQSFLIDGQQVLVRHSTSEAGMNDFASGLLAGGPNVFLDDTATASLGASGAFEGWSSGILYERVHIPNARLQLLLDFSRAQGAGWTAANSILWNSTAQSVDAIGPPAAANYVINSPQSLYETQLQARIGTTLLPETSVSSSFPPSPLWFASPKAETPANPPQTHPVQIINGRFVLEGKTLWGPSQGEAWWRGDTSPYTAGKSTGSSVSRFMPGVTAPGLTEDLPEMASRLKARGIVSIQINPGLWYDHRRDAHTVERRDDGNVWAPFFEAPWARSGQGTAWDGLSKFDLSRYNPWYFERQKQFAQQAAQQGFLIFYDLYNTHDVLEIGPHWIDYAWRPANNINNTGLPEPPPLKPHNRNDVGNQFFSTTNPELKALHRAYMLHTFDQLGDQPNVIFGIAYQYAGPLEFEQFFQDTAREWESTHPGRHIRFALTTSKQTTDAILQDPIRSKQIAVVDMRYWEYRPDGTLFAPKAGENHAFRELISLAFPGYTDTPPVTTPEQVYRATREYRDRYPNIALMPMEDGAGPIPILMGGGASQSALVGGRTPAPKPSAEQQASAMYPLRPATAPPEHANADHNLEAFIQTNLATSLMNLSPRDGWTAAPDHTWTLAGSPKDPILLYSLSGPDITLTHPLPHTHYAAQWFDPETGQTQPAEAKQSTYAKPNASPWLLLLKPE
ncbi:DUF6298 domain-containing protein [Granulicella tundricola]|uniref:DUF6298 domain-containing protein n=1 Tax=Granulicella tundricola (strain ATCC BAA-1859 / DSM 23138 / MP5ACTX9) TaxID=1198114 RepID=E8X415_GRATM|nr:DUF6298 domain-containing protein [Granulicella tundricola]ADW70523.1 hypothetical protein AciX9_3518 [Granulicella tundricola MP5ACTX9]